MKLVKTSMMPEEFFEELSARVPNGIYDYEEETAIFPHDCLEILENLPMVKEVRDEGITIYFTTIEV